MVDVPTISNTVRLDNVHFLGEINECICLS